MSDRWTVRKATAWTTEFLEGKGVDAPRTDADSLLLADALGVDRIRLIRPDKPLGVEELASYRQRIERRAGGEPLAYILGRREFHGHEFLVDTASHPRGRRRRGSWRSPCARKSRRDGT